jgi:hypothetical protein
MKIAAWIRMKILANWSGKSTSEAARFPHH